VDDGGGTAAAGSVEAMSSDAVRRVAISLSSGPRWRTQRRAFGKPVRVDHDKP
jgi:hypothetical protein